MAYKAIFFDIGWTLMQPKRSWFLNDLFYELAPVERVAEEQLSEAITLAMPILDENHKMSTMEEEEHWFTLFYQKFIQCLPELGLTDRDAVLLAHDKTYNYKNYVFFPDALPVLTRLKENCRLGVISDTWPSAVGFLKDARIYDLFDHFTFSYQLGVFKPNAKMYQHALNGLRLPPEETLFVDDCPECLIGAQESGITPIQMLKKPELSPAPGIKTVSSLTELELYLS